VKERHELQLVLFPDATSARHEIGDEELKVSPWPAKVIVTGNNWTKFNMLVGLQGLLKKAAGLGGLRLLVRIPSCCLVIPLEFFLVVGSLSKFFAMHFKRKE
jgi:hypothetical protein